MKTLAEIMARLAEINTRMAAIRTEANAPETTTERMAELDAEVANLTNERADLTRKSVQLRAEAQNFAPVITGQNGASENHADERGADYYASLEYRQAFKTWVLERRATPALRADASTTTSGITSVIVPTVITDQLYAKKDNAGSIFARVRKTNYPAGQSIKTVNFKPELEWVAENGKTDRKNATTGEIVFNGYKAQIRLAISLEAKTMSLAQFEAALVDRLLKACSRGFDKAIVVGSGSGQPTGIITGATYTGEKSNAVTLNNKTVEDYSEWIKIWAKIPLAEQSGAHLHINKEDWQAHILGMKDSTGKVIALETMGFGGNLVPMFMGREVVLLENQGLKTFDSITGSATKSANTAFAYFFNNDAYCFNSNLQLTLRQYIDEDTDETIHKATVIADGKVVDSDSLLVVCRGANA